MKSKQQEERMKNTKFPLVVGGPVVPIPAFHESIPIPCGGG